MSNTFSEARPVFAPLWERRWLVAIVLAVSLGLGICYTFFAPPVWEAQATVIFPVRQPSVLGASGADASALASALGGPTPVRVYAGILESARTRAFVAEQTGMRRKEVEKMTKVLDQSMENSITVLARSTDPELAKRVVQLNLDALETINEDLNMPLAENDVDALNKRIDDQRTRIAEAEGQLLEFQNTAITAPRVTAAGTSRETAILAAPASWVATLRELEIQRAKVESEIKQAYQWGDRIAANGEETPSPFPGAEKWRTTLAELDYELRVAKLTYSTQAPEVTKIEDQIEIARTKLEDEIASYVEATRAGFIAPSGTGALDIPKLLSDKVSLDAQIEAVGKLVELAPGEAIELSRRMREIATDTMILHTLEGQLQLAILQQSRDPNRWEVLDSPTLSEEPVNKSFLRNGVVSLFGGLVLAFALALLWKKRPNEESVLRQAA
jgi:uncharacterized protein involved in exopolysaccharide biosynthesis